MSMPLSAVRCPLSAVRVRGLAHAMVTSSQTFSSFSGTSPQPYEKGIECHLPICLAARQFVNQNIEEYIVPTNTAGESDANGV